MPSDRPEAETKALGRHMVAQRQSSGGWYVGTKRGNAILGLIAWNAQWRQFVFRPLDMAEFSGDCLADLAEFLTELNAAGEGA